jgi:V/A-type H+-transporting ATPase subunit I
VIVPMKKATVFVRQQDEARALDTMKSLGVLHIDTVTRESAPLADLSAERDALDRALAVLGDGKKARRAKGFSADDAAPADLAGSVLAVKSELEAARNNLRKFEEELRRLAPWGDFDPAGLRALREQGIEIRLFELTAKELAALPAGLSVFRLARHKGAILAALASYKEDIDTGLKPVHLPAESTAALAQRRDDWRSEVKRLEARLLGLSVHRQSLVDALAGKNEAIEYEEVHLTFQAEPEILYLAGFVPAPEVEGLKAAATAEGWGIAIAEPGPEDDVPVLVRRSPLLRMIKPVFDFLGTVPGYREYDISLPFLVFFSIFIAMLVGDAGYGLTFLLFTIVGRVVLRKIPTALFGLLLLTSVATTVWGTLTGTWFGSAALAELPPLKALIIDAVATFSKTDNRPLMMLICFIIGLVHITLAHLLSAIRNRKAFKGLAEVGRLGLVWGMFFFVLYLVLQQPLQPFAVWLVFGGLALVFIFEQQTGPYGPGVFKAILTFLKGVGKGFANLFLTALSAVSTLADIISYVRLFAVGLAGVEIAKTFNGMAAAVGGGLGVLGIILSILVLFVGHALNMVLSLMSVLVHGVRLNMLEFSGHLGMEWSGRPFKPFAERLPSK